jgi:Xaa-Pro aminopeptidase
MTVARGEAMGDIDRLEREIAASGFDAVIAVSPENVRYASDVHIDTQRRLRDRLAFVVWPTGGEPVFLVCQMEAAYVREYTWMRDVRTYREFTETPVSALAAVMRELRVDAGSVALETGYLAATHFMELTRLCPRLRVEPAEPLFARLRMFKTAREKAQIIHAFQATERAFLAAFSRVSVGETERDVAVRLGSAILAEGAELVNANNCNAGANTGYPHMAPSEYRVRPGDIVKADSGGIFRQYLSNVGRTAKVGRPSEEDLSIWKRLREVHHTVIDACRVGRTGRELFDLAKRTQEKLGLAFTYSHNGHSIGLTGHEHPIINAHEDIPYQVGMLTTVETRARWPGRVGYHMEDIIEITGGAPVCHAKDFPNEELLVV